MNAPPGVHASLACWPAKPHDDAMKLASAGALEPLFGRLSTAHVQIVPQCLGVFDVDAAAQFAQRWPGSTARLHANVRVAWQPSRANLSTFKRDLWWFEAAARVHQVLKAPAYCAHAGRRTDGDLAELLDNAKRCADLFGSPVAVEGQYPTREAGSSEFVLSTWDEYAQLLRSGVPMALDLSHLNIVAAHSGCQNLGLVAELLASPACLEVHVSHNNGRADTHGVCSQPTWWWPLLSHLNPGAVVFSEGNHVRAAKENPHVT